jgi:antitoxin HicB
MRYAYPCNIALDKEEKEATGREAYTVTFRDVPEAITGGWSRDEALEMAEDGLGVALGMYISAREDIPKPSSLADDEILVAVPPIIAAKLALYKAMREQGITNVALADRLGLSEGAVRRLVNPEHRSHIGQVERALRAVGHTLVVEDIAAA